MVSLRSKRMHNIYVKALANGLTQNGCNLCKESKVIKDFKYWKVINNDFPYDLIAKVNHMIVPKRHATYKTLNSKEKKEYEYIKNTFIEKKYHILVETVVKRQSIGAHFHTNLIIFK